MEARGNAGTEAEGEAEGLHAAFASVCHSPSSSPPGTQPPELEGGDGERHKPPVTPAEAAEDLLRRLDTHQPTGPAGIPPRVLRELAEELAKALSITAQQPWVTGEVPDGWRLANGTPIHKRGRQEDAGSYGPASLTWVPRKVMEPSS